MQRWVPYACVALAQVLFGSSVVANKVLTQHLPIYFNLSFRLAIALVFLTTAMVWLEKGIPRISVRESALFLLQALTGVVGFGVTIMYGLKWISAIEGGIITSFTPILIAVLSVLFLREAMNRRKWISVALAFSGILLIVVTQGGWSGVQLRAEALYGYLLVFMTAICEAVFTITSKKVSGRFHPVTSTTIVLFYALLLMAPFGIWEGMGVDWAGIGVVEWVSLLYSAVFVMVIAFLCMYIGVRKIQGNMVGVYTGLAPISSMVLSALILHESIRWVHLLGLALVISAIVLSTWAEEREENALMEALRLKEHQKQLSSIIGSRNSGGEKG